METEENCGKQLKLDQIDGSDKYEENWFELRVVLSRWNGDKLW